MPLFAATILLSAFLLFLVQPIIAKQILPWFGGTSAVWTTCLVFFQVTLLAGYSYAHLITRRLAPRQQSLLHIALLLASLAFVPIVASAAFKPTGEEDAALRILVLLGATIGLPYFLLSTTGPLLQKWVAHRFPEKTVYRLFALSNFGSLVGLLAFPFAIEPFASSQVQSWLWSGAYAVFVLACAATAWAARTRPAAPHEPAGPPQGRIPQGAARRYPSELALTGAAGAAGGATTATAEPPAPIDIAMWLVLAALGSVMLLAASSHITQNIASVPFLWVVPLALYLLTFVLAFEGRGGRGFYDTRWGTLAMLAFVVLMAGGLTASNAVLDIGLAVPLFCAGMFVACLYCHGELAARKPQPAHLTLFYLMLSLGGALGGLFVALVAPRVFPTYYELPLALFALAALSLLLTWTHRALAGPWMASLALTSMVATGVTAYLGLGYSEFLRSDVIHMQRNFYGTLRVREVGTGDTQWRRLLHGVILHGEQRTASDRRLEPGSYYARSSGIGLALEALQQQGPVRLGFVGLGVGTLAAYGRAGDTVRFYELDPDVLRLARSHFTFLESTPATLDVVLGDARLSLERELAQRGPRGYDVLAIDAFSSDSIPVHLITREAIELYARHVAPDGLIALHISNRFLDLQPVLANIAAATGLVARHVADSPAADSDASSTDWVLLARDEAVFAQGGLAQRAEPLPPRPGMSLWTDQFNNMLDVLKAQPWDELKRLVGLH